MNILYTTHAEENILERKLSKKLIEDVLRNPSKVKDGRYGRKIADKVIENKVLRVIYEKENNVYIIITAYYTKFGRYGD